MKNISIALNILLLIAVAFLYYKIYSEPKQPMAKPLPASDGKNTVVFVNADTLFEKYKLFDLLNDAFDKQRDSVDEVLKRKDATLKSEAAKYQQNAAGMTDEERARTEDDLMKKNSILLSLKDELYDQLRQKQSQMEDSIHNNISRYLKEFNKDKNYAFVLSYQRGSGVLLANDSLDITNQVLEGLNSDK